MKTASKVFPLIPTDFGKILMQHWHIAAVNVANDASRTNRKPQPLAPA